MAFIIGLYIVVDVVGHKGLIRTLLPKEFPSYKIDNSFPKTNNTLINTGKEWVKAVNTKELMNAIDEECSGIECDVYFEKEKELFEVHHDIDNSNGLNLIELLDEYGKRGLTASIWLDFKNLDDSNYIQAITVLSGLRIKYKLTNKLLVESNRADLLTVFSDSGFFTSYYSPLFNPYLISNQEIKYCVDSVSAMIKRSRVNAISGYYFQYPFLHHYFPGYPILIWAANNRYSVVNRLFKKKMATTKEVFIVLYPL